MQYVNARLDEEYRDTAYRIYVTDSLYYNSINKCLSKRYIDIINPEPDDNRSGNEIAMSVISRAGLELIDGPI